MTRLNKILLPVFVIIATIVVSIVIKSRNTRVSNSQTFVSVKASENSKNNSSTQENDGGNVKIIVMPKTLAVGEKPSFDIVFETHSVDLDFDVVQISSLVDEKGQVFNKSIWEGSEPGGHHREGNLTFNTILSKTKFAKLIIRDVSDIPERTFRWEL